MRSKTSAVLLLFITVCFVIPKICYSDSLDANPPLTDIEIYADLVVLEDVQGTKDQIDLERNRTSGETVIKIFSDALKTKGYTVGGGQITSLGLALNPERKKYQVILSDATEEKNYNRPRQTPPYYVNESFDAAKIESFRKLYAELTKAKIKKDRVTGVSEFGFLDKGPGHGALIILGEGRSVPTTEQVMQAVGSTAMTFGLFTVWGMDNMRMSIYLVDTHTGEILLGEKATAHFSANQEHIDQVARKLAKRLPEKTI